MRHGQSDQNMAVFHEFELAVCDECPDCAGCRGACKDGLWDHHQPCDCEEEHMEPDGDDQLAKTDDVEIVTRVDFLEAPELDEDDPEPEDATDEYSEGDTITDPDIPT